MASSQRIPTPAFATLANFPSPNLADRILVEQYDHKLPAFGPRNAHRTIPAYGQAHPDTAKYPNFRLVYVALVQGSEATYNWYWVNDRASQDAYNEEADLSGDLDIWRRTYLVRRSAFVSQAEGTADPVVTTRKLIREQLNRIGDEVLDSLYVVVIRTYANFDTVVAAPTQLIAGGTPKVLEFTDEDHRIVWYRYTQIVAKDQAIPVNGVTVASMLGTTYSSGKRLAWGATAWSASDNYIYVSKKTEFEQSSEYRLLTVEFGPIPPTRYEYPSVGFQFPGIFEILDDAWIEAGPDDGFTTVRPWAGVNFSLTAPVSKSVMAKETISYGIEGSESTPPSTFHVVCPAAASRFWRDLPANCIHPALTINEYSASLAILTPVETFPASTPAPGDYTVGDPLVIQCNDKHWRGSRIKERRTVQVSQTQSPYDY